MTRQSNNRARRILIATALAVASAANATDITPGDAARFSIGQSLLPSRSTTAFTLLDPTLALRPVPELDAARWLDASLSPATAAPAQPGEIDWRLDYRHSLLDEAASNSTLRGDASTGFSRQLDRDVVDLGLTWRLAGSRLGLAYQLQSARSRNAAEAGVSRFMPGSPQATHALTLGVTREWGSGALPPALVAVPLLAAEEERTATLAAPTPTHPR